MAFFSGEHEQTIDGKHRIAISAQLRREIDPEEDGRNFILIVGPDRHLWLYPDKYYRRLLSTLRRSPFPSREQRKLALVFGMARVVNVDKQGRLVLPEKSMQRATISDAVTLVGNDDRIEIWPTQEWERYVEDGMPSYGEMLYEAAERLNAESSEAS